MNTENLFPFPRESATGYRGGCRRRVFCETAHAPTAWSFSICDTWLQYAIVRDICPVAEPLQSVERFARPQDRPIGSPNKLVVAVGEIVVDVFDVVGGFHIRFVILIIFVITNVMTLQR